MKKGLKIFVIIFLGYITFNMSFYLPNYSSLSVDMKPVVSILKKKKIIELLKKVLKFKKYWN